MAVAVTVKLSTRPVPPDATVPPLIETVEVLVKRNVTLAALFTAAMLEDPAIRTDILQRTPAGRLVTTDEVAATVVFLASPASRMTTGAALTVDGGWTAI